MAWRRRLRNPAAVALLAAGVTAGLVAMGATPASASCAGGGSFGDRIEATVADGGPVFVGTVVSTTNDGTWATFAVDEVWAGDVPDEIEVKGDADHRKFTVVSALPVIFEPGTQYLVTPTQVRPPYDPFFGSDEGDYELSPCGETPVFNQGLTAYRPDTARVVHRAEPAEIIGAVPMPTDEGPPWLAIGATSVIVFGGIAGLVVLRRRRRPVDVDVDGTYL